MLLHILNVYLRIKINMSHFIFELFIEYFGTLVVTSLFQVQFLYSGNHSWEDNNSQSQSVGCRSY